ncbi:shikimate kinase [Tamlana sp. I1]|uniref:shikimate kinase n=1 Tax=Tamlana sp. I1 TaxID=2762061 RepID=UPI0018902842|nr:shikimate kinase [Tamlana sp. I1]
MIIVLIGYMASGKTSIGKKLANKLNYAFVDLDDVIEERENASVTKVFKTKGEIYFRKQEALYLRELLTTKANTILSLGGGAPCYSNNMDAVLNAENTTSIYLNASIPTLVEKLMKKKAKRPLIAHIETEEAMAEFIGKHLFERLQFYNQAELKVSIDNKSKDEVVDAIVSELF